MAEAAAKSDQPWAGRGVAFGLSAPAGYVDAVGYFCQVFTSHMIGNTAPLGAGI